MFKAFISILFKVFILISAGIVGFILGAVIFLKMLGSPEISGPILLSIRLAFWILSFIGAVLFVNIKFKNSTLPKENIQNKRFSKTFINLTILIVTMFFGLMLSLFVLTFGNV